MVRSLFVIRDSYHSGRTVSGRVDFATDPRVDLEADVPWPMFHRDWTP